MTDLRSERAFALDVDVCRLVLDWLSLAVLHIKGHTICHWNDTAAKCFCLSEHNGKTLADLLSAPALAYFDAETAKIGHEDPRKHLVLTLQDGREVDALVIRDTFNTSGHDCFIVFSNVKQDGPSIFHMPSWERLQDIHRNSREAILIVREGIVIDCNEAAVRLFGYASDLLRGMSVTNLFYIADESEQLAALYENLAEGKECQAIRQDGKLFPVEALLHKGEYLGGPVDVLTVQDISRRIWAEQELSHSQALLHAAVQGTQVGIWEWNLVTNMVRINDVLQQMLNLPSDCQSLHIFSVLNALEYYDLDAIMANVRDHLSGQVPVINQVLKANIRKTGCRVFEIKGSRYPVGNGAPRYIVGTVADITERYQMEQALRDNEALLKALIENRMEVVWAVDTNYSVLFYNKNFFEGFRLVYGIELQVGKHILDGLDESVAELWKKRYDICLQGEQLQFVDATKLITSTRYIEFIATPLCDQDGSIMGVSVVGRDVTEQKKVEERLRESYRQLEEAWKIRSQFVASLSHEIRTPMNGILGFTELMLQTPLNAKQREYMQIIHSSSQSLLHLVNDLLEMSRIESGKLVLVTDMFNLHTLVKEVVQSFNLVSNKKDIQLHSRIGDRVPLYVFGDKQRLRQVLSNLLDNAIKFSEQGDVCLILETLDLQEDACTLHFEVQDQGPGIAPHLQQIIFEPFGQVDSSLESDRKGLGLGLYISREIIRLMGGEIRVESTPGKGSRFYFQIRLALPVVGKAVHPSE